MTQLHLGVVELPYDNGPDESAQNRKRPRKAIVTASTGDVATWLENKYHVMEHFFELHGPEIAAALENGLAGSLESVVMGAPTPENPFAGAAEEIEKLFRRMLDSREFDALGYPGIPTKAAQKGVSQRFKRRHGPPRPSFEDTGLYEASFKVWAD